MNNNNKEKKITKIISQNVSNRKYYKFVTKTCPFESTHFKKTFRVHK